MAIEPFDRRVTSATPQPFHFRSVFFMIAVGIVMLMMASFALFASGGYNRSYDYERPAKPKPARFA